MNLPRLLEEGRVEVRLVGGGTHVLDEAGVDSLLSHLAQAKQLLNPGYCDELATLRRELEKAKDALKFYAAEETWQGILDVPPTALLMSDGGIKAKTILDGP